MLASATCASCRVPLSTVVTRTCLICCLQVQASAGPSVNADPQRLHTWTNAAFEEVAAAPHKGPHQVCSCPGWAPAVCMCMQEGVVLRGVLLAVPRRLSLL